MASKVNNEENNEDKSKFFINLPLPSKDCIWGDVIPAAIPQFARNAGNTGSRFLNREYSALHRFLQLEQAFTKHLPVKNHQTVMIIVIALSFVLL